jgi:hypothetical protein
MSWRRLQALNVMRPSIDGASLSGRHTATIARQSSGCFKNTKSSSDRDGIRCAWGMPCRRRPKLSGNARNDSPSRRSASSVTFPPTNQHGISEDNCFGPQMPSRRTTGPRVGHVHVPNLQLDSALLPRRPTRLHIGWTCCGSSGARRAGVCKNCESRPTN